MSTREKANILLVDDQPGKLASLEVVLASLDENVITTNSAEAALKQLLEHDIAVVLVDVCMPNMDGFELAELIRTHPRFSRTAIIFISAVHLTDDDRLRGYSLGAVDYMPVPIIPEVLRAKVAVFTELYRKTNQLEKLNAELARRVEELDASNERLRFADRMATIGTLAAGLGHDMGNLLLPIRMRLDSLSGFSLPPQGLEDIAAIRKGTEYLQRLSNSLRLLTSDPQIEGVANATDLGDWWRESEGIIRTSVGRTIALSAMVPSGLPPVRIGRAGLTQLVFNLVQNASDALCATPNARIDLVVEPGPSDRSVRLRVSDNGPGMNEVAKRRCLEPFFTTKPRELSTGLGLTLVASLVRRAQGSIHLDSEIGRGTAFTVELPVASPTPSGGVPEFRRPVATVTMIDSRILAHVRSVLASLGHDVREGDPAESDVWVTEVRNDDDAAAVRRFTDSGRDCRALVFGRVSERAEFSERVTLLEPDQRPSLLRAQIQTALGLQNADLRGISG
ncbi:MAG TPA: ATP-binding protein [Phycisphaerales bacterium]